MAKRPWWADPPNCDATQGGETPQHGPPVRLYDPAAIRSSIGEDWDDFVGPEDEPSSAPRNTEDEVRAHRLRRILDDPRGEYRPALLGTLTVAARLVDATKAMPHFCAVTGVIERAVLQASHTGRPITFPPILMVSEPGLGKTHCSRTVARALGTTCIPISINGTSDRGNIGGLSSAWRGAKTGKIAHGLLVASSTAAPLYLLDEIDKPTAIAGENVLDVLLSALEPENAAVFVDEYVGVPIDLSNALWLASANDESSMPVPLLDRMLVVDVPWPDRDTARVLAGSVSADVLERVGLEGVDGGALELLLHLSPRAMRRSMELACAFAAARRRPVVTGADVRAALDLVVRHRRRRIGFLGDAGRTIA